MPNATAAATASRPGKVRLRTDITWAPSVAFVPQMFAAAKSQRLQTRITPAGDESTEQRHSRTLTLFLRSEEFVFRHVSNENKTKTAVVVFKCKLVEKPKN